MIREKIEKIVADELEKVRYIYKRYHCPFCLLVIESSIPVDLLIDRLELRLTDHVRKIDDKSMVVLLCFTGEEKGGYKATENLLMRMESLYPDGRFHIGIACKDSDRVGNIVTRAVYALSKAKDHENNFIEDDSDLD